MMKVYSGPCVLESEDLARKVVERLLEEFQPINDKIEFVFKGSFDKANRSSIDSYRGPGIEEGLRILSIIKNEYKVPVVTDFHTPEMAKMVGEVVDVLQIPAFLCRQTDMIVEGAKAMKQFGGSLNIKKGQFLSPEEMKNVVIKAENFLPKDRILLTERGTFFGYQNLVVDMSSFTVMNSLGVETLHDATHCIQRPGALGKSTGGKREFMAPLAQAAMAAGASGVFFESHIDPENALSDASTCLNVKYAGQFIEKLLKIKEAAND